MSADDERAAAGLPTISTATSASPASSGLPAGSLPAFPRLNKSDSSASAGRFSITSHVSIPVTGALPFGSLRLVGPAEAEGAAVADGKVEATSGERAPSTGAPDGLLAGDVFLILGLPARFTVGCDDAAMTTGPAGFPGLRDLPPGPHFVWVAEAGALTRSGHWFVTESKGRVRVKQWDHYNEVLGDAASQFEERNQRNNLESVYASLVPYPCRRRTASPPSPPADPPTPPPKDLPWPSSATPDPDIAQDPAVIWRLVTSAITQDVLRRVTGRRGTADEWLVDTADTVKGDVDFSHSAKLFRSAVGSHLTFLFPRDAVDLHLVSLADRDTSVRRPGAARVPDTSSDVLAVLSFAAAGVGESDIVGELQFVFLTGMHLTNLCCIEHWWHLLLNIILRAHTLVVSRPGLCRALIKTLHAQLVYSDRTIAGADAQGSAGAAILDTIPSNRLKLRTALTLYKRRLNDALLSLGDAITPEQAAVGHAFVAIEAWFWKYGWDLRSDYVPDEIGTFPLVVNDDNDYHPIVVQLDEHGKEVGLVSWS